MEPSDSIGHLLKKKAQERAELERQIALIDAEMRGLEQARAVITQAADVKERFAEVVANTGRRNKA